MKKKSILKKMESYSHTCTCDLCGADEEAHAEVHSHDIGTASPWDKLLIIRIAVAAVLFCLGMVLPVPETVELLLLIASTLVAGYDVFISAIVHVWRHHVLDECLLMSLASIAAFVIGEDHEGAAVMLLFQIGELLQGYAVGRTRRAVLNLVDPRPEEAWVLRDGEVCAVAPEDVKVGETLCIEQGKTFPLDCIVTQGEGVVDNSPLFGAGEPQRVAPESTVLAGAVNLSGTIWAEATAEAEDSTAAKLMETLEDDLDKKGETERFLTKFSRIYTPIVLSLAILAMICLPLIFRVPVGESIHRGLVFLVIACPCALVISVPLAYFAGIGGAAKQGILFKSSTAMDKIAKTKAVVFDKTGTLTTGQFRVTAVKSDKMDADMLLKIAAHAEAYSSHPIAKAIISAYGGVIYIELIESFREFAGRGITVTVNGIPITLGSQEFLESQGVSLSADGGVERAVYMAIQGIYAGRIILSDTIKADSAEAIRSLTEAGGERIAMVTGDSRQSSGDLAKAMGIGEYYAECLPGDKVARVQDMKSKMGGGSLIFVGDGKPTPEAADVGVDMGGLRHQTERADVIIMDDRPTKVATAIYAARSTRRIVFENIAVIFAFKLAVLILGALGISAMWFAVLADSGIAVAASLNSIRAFYIRRPK